MNYAMLALAVQLWETPKGEMVGDNGASVSRYQIQEIAVDEINRVCHTHYTYADRATKGREMFITYAKYLHEKKGYSAQQIYQVWNAGDNAVRKGESIRRGKLVATMYAYIQCGDVKKAKMIGKNRSLA